MGFEYRAADQKSHAHAFLLGRKETVEQALNVVGFYTDAVIRCAAAIRRSLTRPGVRPRTCVLDGLVHTCRMNN